MDLKTLEHVLSEIEKSDFWKDSYEESFALSARHPAKRANLSFLLCDQLLMNIAKRWDIYEGEHDAMILRRLNDLGMPSPSSALFRWLKRSLSNYGDWQNNREKKRSKLLPVEYNKIFEYYSQSCYTKELRCACCGYHFVESDTRPDVVGYAQDNDLTFSSEIDQRRLEDDYKPVSHKGKDRLLTKLEIDHFIPVSAFGHSSPENLQVLCYYCNKGKGDWIYPYEEYGYFVTNAIPSSYGYTNDWSDNLYLYTRIFVSAIWNSSGVCQKCGCTNQQGELTLRLKKDSKCIVPWNLEVICYDCIDDA